MDILSFGGNYAAANVQTSGCGPDGAGDRGHRTVVSAVPAASHHTHYPHFPPN